MSSPIANLKSVARSVLIKLRVMFDRVVSRHAGLTPSPVPLPAVSESNRPQSPMTRRRRAITLLEVLISMFIMTVGLLSVASLVPLGKVQQARADKTVRSSACGRAAFREISVHGILNPNAWSLGHVADPNDFTNYEPAKDTRVYDPAAEAFRFTVNRFDPNSTGTYSTPSTVWGGFAPVVIDPLGVAGKFGPWFPFPHAVVDATTPPYPYAAPAPPVAPVLPRLTLTPYSAAFKSINNNMRAAMADLVFRNADDITFAEAASEDGLPSQILQSTHKRSSQGDYSWLVTIIPDSNLISTANYKSLPCTVSVAVFHKRSLTIPGSGERMCFLDTTRGNIQDEIRLRLPAVDVAPQYAGDGKTHLNVKAQQWIMLAGWNEIDHDNNVATPLVKRWYYGWHRIIAVDDTIQTGTIWTKNVTLSGPFTDMSTTPIPAANVTAFLFDGIQNVYEKNMTLQLD
jgi:hypothetical protein